MTWGYVLDRFGKKKDARIFEGQEAQEKVTGQDT